MKLTDLNLELRTFNALSQAGISGEQVASMYRNSDLGILCDWIRNFGAKAKADLETALNKYYQK